MAIATPHEIENEFSRLTPEAQLNLLERLVHRVRLAVVGRRDPWKQELSAMAADPEIQRELKAIETEFQTAETDGLGGA